MAWYDNLTDEEKEALKKLLGWMWDATRAAYASGLLEKIIPEKLAEADRVFGRIEGDPLAAVVPPTPAPDPAPTPTPTPDPPRPKPAFPYGRPITYSVFLSQSYLLRIGDVAYLDPYYAIWVEPVSSINFPPAEYSEWWVVGYGSFPSDPSQPPTPKPEPDPEPTPTPDPPPATDPEPEPYGTLFHTEPHWYNYEEGDRVWVDQIPPSRWYVVEKDKRPFLPTTLEREQYGVVVNGTLQILR